MTAALVPYLLVAGCIAGLGADDYAARHRSAAVLTAFGEAARPQLTRARRSPDAEVSRAAEALLARLDGRKWEARSRAVWGVLAEAHFDRAPWIDSLPKDYPERWSIVEQYLAAARATDVSAAMAPDFPRWRKATELFVADLINGPKSVGELQLMLRQMVKGDAQQVKEHPTWHYAGSRDES